ncbi:MAG: signal recognition particle-docking protein FtsY, partial [Elusimicrobiota bacterium]|nr:signal recognition particle-docking protein FtsY [Elusimicrobiota bacterium]
MPEPADELERILADARAQLGRIRLEVPELEDGTPAPREVQEWARSSLAVAPVEPVIAVPPPQAVPSVSLEPLAPPAPPASLRPLQPSPAPVAASPAPTPASPAASP